MYLELGRGIMGERFDFAALEPALFVDMLRKGWRSRAGAEGTK
jgi:hypothetical protein